jgi:hypothetical protein
MSTPSAPVACSLDSTGLSKRVGEWQEQLRSVVSSQRSGSALMLQLASDADLGALAELCRQEVACCPFFSFRLEVSAAGASLVVEVPTDAAELLDDLEGLAGRS